VKSLDAGRLELVDVLGEGGMATVMRAWDHRDGSWKAVKLLAPRLARSTALRARFANEAAVMSRLDHPGICRVFGFAEDGGQLYIEMELINGGSLAQWLGRNGPMPPRMALDAVVQVCEAVEVAHDAGIIHRDLKPDNVLVGPDGACRVVDFGIARLSDAVSTTRTGITMGSYGFMAPEQVDNAKDVDARADVFSLASILVALVTDARLTDLDDALRRASERLPQELMLTLVRGTTSQRDHRTGTVRQLRRRLERAREHLVVTPAGTPSLHHPLTAVGVPFS
jgi:serine/threonine protein kinase